MYSSRENDNGSVSYENESVCREKYENVCNRAVDEIEEKSRWSRVPGNRRWGKKKRFDTFRRDDESATYDMFLSKRICLF